MDKLSCYGSDGVALDYVCQWDANRVIRIRGVTISESCEYQVHFCNRTMTRAIVLEPTIEDPDLIVRIPTVLLEVPEIIYIYVYEIDSENDEAATVGVIKIPVIIRDKPTNYVSESTIGNSTVADGLTIQDGSVYLSNDGTIFGSGVVI